MQRVRGIGADARDKRRRQPLLLLEQLPGVDALDVLHRDE